MMLQKHLKNILNKFDFLFSENQTMTSAKVDLRKIFDQESDGMQQEVKCEYLLKFLKERFGFTVISYGEESYPNHPDMVLYKKTVDGVSIEYAFQKTKKTDFADEVVIKFLHPLCDRICVATETIYNTSYDTDESVDSEVAMINMLKFVASLTVEIQRKNLLKFEKVPRQVQ